MTLTLTLTAHPRPSGIGYEVRCAVCEAAAFGGTRTIAERWARQAGFEVVGPLTTLCAICAETNPLKEETANV